MMHTIKSYKRVLASLGMAAILTAAVAAPAFAAESDVTVTVSGGTLTASIANTSLDPVAYSHNDRTTGGALNLTVDDSRGTGAGWNVTVQSSDFTSGSNTISSANFSIETANTPTHNAGQTIDATGGPLAGNVGALDSPVMVLSADEGYGQGNYSQELAVELNVPGSSQAGTYTATVTVTANSGPAS